MSVPAPAFDEAGYPTEATLAIITVWPYRDFLTLMEFVRQAWKYEEYFVQDGDRFHLSTGGWSGNEDIIGALQQHRLFWAVCWESSHRGGITVFKVPNPPPPKEPL